MMRPQHAVLGAVVCLTATTTAHALELDRNMDTPWRPTPFELASGTLDGEFKGATPSAARLVSLDGHQQCAAAITPGAGGNPDTATFDLNSVGCGWLKALQPAKGDADVAVLKLMHAGNETYVRSVKVSAAASTADVQVDAAAMTLSEKPQPFGGTTDCVIWADAWHPCPGLAVAAVDPTTGRHDLSLTGNLLGQTADATIRQRLSSTPPTPVEMWFRNAAGAAVKAPFAFNTIIPAAATPDDGMSWCEEVVVKQAGVSLNVPDRLLHQLGEQIVPAAATWKANPDPGRTDDQKRAWALASQPISRMKVAFDVANALVAPISEKAYRKAKRAADQAVAALQPATLPSGLHPTDLAFINATVPTINLALIGVTPPPKREAPEKLQVVCIDASDPATLTLEQVLQIDENVGTTDSTLITNRVLRVYVRAQKNAVVTVSSTGSFGWSDGLLYAPAPGAAAGLAGPPPPKITVHQFPPHKAGSASLKVKLQNIKVGDLTEREVEFPMLVEATYWGAFRLGLGFTPVIDRTYAVETPVTGGAPRVVARDGDNIARFDVLTGVTVFFERYRETDLQRVHGGWYFGLAVFEASTGGAGFLRAFHTGPELSFTKHFSIAMTGSVRFGSVPEYGFEPGRPVAAGTTEVPLQAYPVFSFIGLAINFSPEVFTFVTTRKGLN